MGAFGKVVSKTNEGESDAMSRTNKALGDAVSRLTL